MARHWKPTIEEVHNTHPGWKWFSQWPSSSRFHSVNDKQTTDFSDCQQLLFEEIRQDRQNSNNKRSRWRSQSSEYRNELKDFVCIPPFPSKLYHWCSLLTPQQNTNTTNQQGACSFFFTFSFFCLLQTLTLSLLLGNFIFGPENFRLDSGSASGSVSLVFLSESFNLVSVLKFGLTLGDDSSVDLKTQQR